MLRLTEIGLFLVPFTLFVAWLVLGRVGRREAIAAGIVFVAMAAATIWYGLERRLDRGETYVPAHLEDGRIVQGHGQR